MILARRIRSSNERLNSRGFDPGVLAARWHAANRPADRGMQ